ncbi:MAG: thioredoxin family protein [bacterium]
MNLQAGRSLAKWSFCNLCLILLLSSSVVSGQEPKKKNSSPRLQPKTAVWSTRVEPASAKPGDTVTFTATAKLSQGYHLYKLTKTQPESGPRQTELDLFNTGGLTVKGDWKASKEVIKKKEAVFPELEFVEFYEGEVSFSIALEVPANTAPGEKQIQVQAFYQLCDDKNCSIPGRWALPAAVLTIQGGQAAAPKAEPKNDESKAVAIATKDEPKKEKPETVAAAAAPAAEPAKTEEKKTAEPAAALTKVESAPPAATSAVAAAKPPASSSEVQKSLDQGLIPFLLVCAGGGVVALIMPCVWPMVPVTVNFFVKQGHGGKGTTKLAVAYCLSIIGIFTLVGVIFSAFFGAASLQQLANHPYLNIFVAVLFFAFGLSLLGLFEIRLPNFLLNASAQGESRGGMVGVIFMATTLTITSFTCTFPVVGGLLVMAAGGNYLYPVLGLATFATVVAIPFFLLALAPGLMSKMPRGGDWMNTVKTVGGLVEIGAAFKFLNTAEIAYKVPEDAWFDAQMVLTTWIVLAAVCGLYLLGLFRTDHDYEEPKVGPGRILFGSLFLFIAVYLTPALFGRPPQSQIYTRLVVGILPPDAGELSAPAYVVAGGGTGGGAEPSHGTKATSADPQVAITQQTSFHGVVWGMSLEKAKAEAKAAGKPILIDFTGVNCANCRLMEQRVLPRPEVVDQLKKFVTVQIYTDFVPIASITSDQRAELGQANQELLIEIAQEATNPIYVVMNPDGTVLERIGGYNEPAVFVDFLTRAMARFGNGGKVAMNR